MPAPEHIGQRRDPPETREVDTTLESKRTTFSNQPGLAPEPSRSELPYPDLTRANRLASIHRVNSEAGLPESQSPVDASSHPPERLLKPVSCSASESKVAGGPCVLDPLGPCAQNVRPPEGCHGEVLGDHIARIAKRVSRSTTRDHCRSRGWHESGQNCPIPKSRMVAKMPSVNSERV